MQQPTKPAQHYQQNNSFGNLQIQKLPWLERNRAIKSKAMGGLMDRTTVAEMVDMGSIPGRAKSKTIKIGIHSFTAALIWPPPFVEDK